MRCLLLITLLISTIFNLTWGVSVGNSAYLWRNGFCINMTEGPLSIEQAQQEVANRARQNVGSRRVVITIEVVTDDNFFNQINQAAAIIANNFPADDNIDVEAGVRVNGAFWIINGRTSILKAKVAERRRQIQSIRELKANWIDRVNWADY